MVKKKVVYVCESCGNETPRWMGRCPECGEWDTLKQMRFSGSSTLSGRGENKIERPAGQAINLNKVKTGSLKRQKTGLTGFDRVLGGGFVKGQAVLLAGEPGVGKSTLLLQAAAEVIKNSVVEEALYICGEE